MKHYFNEHFYHNFNDFDENELRSIASQILSHVGRRRPIIQIFLKEL